MSRNNINIIAIIMLFTLFIGCGYLAFNYIVQYQVKKEITQTLVNKTNQLDAWLRVKKRLIENLARSLELLDYDKQTHLSFMHETNKIMQTHSVFSGFKDGQYIDTQGYWIDNFDPRIRPWYKETIKTKETTITGPMYYNDISGQKITWWAISSAIFKEGKPFGVISGEILPHMLQEQLKDIKTEKLQQIFLFQKKTGLIIATLDENKKNQFIQKLFSKQLSDLLFSKKRGVKSIEYEKSSSFVYTMTLEEAPWILCAIYKK